MSQSQALMQCAIELEEAANLLGHYGFPSLQSVYQHASERARTEAVSGIPGGIPEGWILARITPTDHMVGRGAHVASEWLDDAAPLNERRYLNPARAVYREMIGVMPTPADEETKTAALTKVLEAASSALRSYQYGNGSTELAEEIADACDQALGRGGL